MTKAVQASRGCRGVLATLALLVAAGCGTTSRVYPGVSREVLWQAALGAARHPQYADWFVAENGVFVDETDGRIEIFRELKRDRAKPGAALKRESETWTLAVTVDTADRIPKVRIESRNTLRAKGFLAQADHYFAEIDTRLAQAGPAAAVEPVANASTGAAGRLEGPAAQEPLKSPVPPPAPEPERSLQSP